MSNIDKAEDSLNSFNETPIYEQYPEVLEDSHTHRVRVLHELEQVAWLRVERGEITADEAEEAIWDCIHWCEQTNEEKGCY